MAKFPETHPQILPRRPKNMPRQSRCNDLYVFYLLMKYRSVKPEIYEALEERVVKYAICIC
jgi:hypothetical protein